MTLSPRARLVLRIVGYVVLALVTFVFALHLTFPYERVRDRALDALTSKYDVNIGGVERSLVPGRFSLTAVTLRSRASVAGQPTTTMYFKRIEIDLAILPLLSGKAEINLDIATGTGRIRGTMTQQKQDATYAFSLTKVPLTMIPGISDAVGLPMAGNADGKVKLKLSRGDWSKANGVFELACNVGCTVGNGEAKIYPKGKRPGDEVWTKDGVAVPQLRIARFKLAIDIVKGEAKKRTFELTSTDGEVELDVNIRLAKVLTESQLTGCLKYKCSKELYDREPKFRSTCDFGSPILDDKGLHTIKLVGKLSNVRRLGALCDGERDDGGAGGGSGGNDRPRIDAPPIEPVRIIDAGVPEIDAAEVPAVVPPPPPPPPGDVKMMRDDVAPPEAQQPPMPQPVPPSDVGPGSGTQPVPPPGGAPPPPPMGEAGRAPPAGEGTTAPNAATRTNP